MPSTATGQFTSRGRQVTLKLTASPSSSPTLVSKSSSSTSVYPNEGVSDPGLGGSVSHECSTHASATDQLSPSVLFAQRDDRFPMCFFPLPLAAAPGWRVQIAFRWPGWNARCKNINFSHCLSLGRGLTRDGSMAHLIMRPSVRSWK